MMFGGFSGLVYVAAGCALCLTVVGIPLGRQLFKLGRLSLMPFGLDVTHPPENLTPVVFVANFVWCADVYIWHARLPKM
jgi:uncharacterized membrane protein YccF (DUF307 family)